jgi:phosphonate transport system substrate-binding protein
VISGLISLVLLAAIGCPRDGTPGTAHRPLRVLLYPSNKGEAAAPARDALAKALASATGLRVETRVPIDYFTAVKDLGSGEVDVALLNNLSYLLAEEIYGARARLTVLRHGGLSIHRGQLLVRADAGIGALPQLEGKRVAFVDPYSVTGFVLAAHLFAFEGVKVGATSFVGSHEEAVRQVYTGDVDVGATYDGGGEGGGAPADLRAKLVEAYPDLGEQIVSLAKTKPIPNEPVVLRRGLDPALADKLVAALRALPQRPEAKQALLDLGDIAGFQDARPEDYAPLREMVKSIGKEVEEMVPGGWRLKLKTSDPVR